MLHGPVERFLTLLNLAFMNLGGPNVKPINGKPIKPDMSRTFPKYYHYTYERK